MRRLWTVWGLTWPHMLLMIVALLLALSMWVAISYDHEAVPVDVLNLE